METRVCIACGGDMKLKKRNLELHSPLCGRRVVNNVPSFCCEGCDRIVFSPEVSKVISKLLAKNLVGGNSIIEYAEHSDD